MSSPLSAALKKLYAGNRAGVEELYNLTSGCVFKIITDILGTGSNASDVLEDVYITIWHNRSVWEECAGPTENDIGRLAHQLALKAAYAAQGRAPGAQSIGTQVDGSTERRGND